MKLDLKKISWGVLILGLVFFGLWAKQAWSPNVDTKKVVTSDKQGQVINTSRSEMIATLVRQERLSAEQAEKKLFPRMTNGVVSLSDPAINTGYAIITATTYAQKAVKDLKIGTIYFYCTTNRSDPLKTIKSIQYASFQPANTKAYEGTVQYLLAGGDTVHYTLNGRLYDRGLVSRSGGKVVAKGDDPVFINYSLIEKTFHYQDVLEHYDIAL
ncbi:hypothetical protein [Lapidilactobacillus luobeiensis]|uniref:hypothetical protein n=1 Tax=Lapidilactobacillus luobeiensis TaxID=2950371 RepID=UPI0021C49DEA|nr:hypothetical protein [Lapidilactobacillus luobeiensis]